MRIVLSLFFLVYASWSDLKTREVSNSVWLLLAPVAFSLTLVQFLVYPPTTQLMFLPGLGDVAVSMISYGFSFAVTTVFSLILFYLGAFGGADAKALICMALALPLPPNVLAPLSGFVSPIFPITVFSNSVIVAAFSVFYALFRNVSWRLRTRQPFFKGYRNVSIGRKTLALLCGYKVSVADLEDSFLYPLEDFQVTEAGEAVKRLLVFPKDESREGIVKRIVKASEEEKIGNTVWATPGLPMLVFITAGLVLACFLGDIVWIVLTQLLQA